MANYNSMSDAQREAAVSIAEKQLERWEGYPVNLAIRQVIRTNDRYKVTGLLGRQNESVTLEDGIGKEFSAVFTMINGGAAYETHAVSVWDGIGAEVGAQIR